MSRSTNAITAHQGQGGTEIRSTPGIAPARAAARLHARWILPLIGLALFAAACGGTSTPQGYAEPQLDGDVLYVSIDAGKIAAVDTSDFSVIWEFPDGDEFACGDSGSSSHDLRAIYGAPVIDGGRLYFGAYDGNVYAVNVEDGTCAWISEDAEGPIIGGAVIADDTLYIGSDDGKLYGLDPETGETRQTFDAGGAIWTTPLLDGKVIYFGTMKGGLWALEAGTLKPQWTQGFLDVEAGLLTDPVLVDGNKLLVGGIGQKLYAVDAENGEITWEFGGGNWFWGRPALDGDIAYATNLDGRVYAINVGTGEAAWESNDFRAAEAVRAGALVTDGAVVVVDRGGNVYSLDPETGDVFKESLSVIEKRVLTNPIEMDGAALVITQNGDLYRVEPSGEEPPRRVEVAE